MARIQGINDPFNNFNFLVEAGGILTGGFSEVTGMNAELQAVEYREGRDASNNTRKLPGLAKYGNVTLKRGVMLLADMYDWFKAGLDGDVKRMDISILLLDQQRQEKVRYNLFAAWPVKFIGPDLKASANEIAVQAIEVAHEGFQVQS